MPPPPPLADDLIEEILIRIPPDDPASLFHAALACKLWYRVASDTGFRRRFCARHNRTPPPVLGVLCNTATTCTSRFVPMCSFRFRPPLPARRRRWRVLDSRHGRVLLASWDRERGPVDDPLVVWDPIAGDHLELPRLPRQREWTSWNAAVLCAAPDCGHSNCRRGPFLVALVSCGRGGLVGHVYSSEAGCWSTATVCLEHADANVDYSASAALVGNAVYFKSDICMQTFRSKIIEYDLSTWKMSAFYLPYELSLWSNFAIDLPLSRLEYGRRIVLMATKDNARLGFGTVYDSKLYLWEREAVSGSVGEGEWAQSKVIDLQALLPADANSISTELVAFADGVGIFFVQTVDGLFSIALKSGQVKKVHNGSDIYSVVPYMTFCTPVKQNILDSRVVVALISLSTLKSIVQFHDPPASCQYTLARSLPLYGSLLLQSYSISQDCEQFLQARNLELVLHEHQRFKLLVQALLNHENWHSCSGVNGIFLKAF